MVARRAARVHLVLASLPSILPPVLAACGGSPGNLPPASTAPAAPAPGSAEAAAVESPAIHVLDSGAEPRRSLRMHPTTGLRRTADFVLTTSTHVLGQAAARVRRPHIATKTRVVAALTVTGTEDAASTWRLEVTSAEALPFEGMSDEFVSGVARSVAPARGASGTFSIPMCGGLGSFEVDTRSLQMETRTESQLELR